MIYERKKLITHRVSLFILLLLGSIITSILCVYGYSDLDTSYIIVIFAEIFIYIDAFILAFFIASFFLSYKEYVYDGKKIIVYAGWYHHYLKIDGDLYDEHNTILSFTAITLSTVLNDGTNIEARITLTNRISLKINNRLYK